MASASSGGSEEESAPPILSVVIDERQGEYPKLVESLATLSTECWRLIRVGTDRDFATAVDSALAEVDTEYVFIAGQDGWLASVVIDVLRNTEGADVVYFDEMDLAGRVAQPHLKPDFSPERLRCQFYLGNAVFYRTDQVRSIGGVRVGFDGAERYDLALRATLDARVIHVAAIGYTTTTGRAPWAIDQDAVDATRLALEDHLALTGGGRVVSVGLSGTHETRRDVLGEPLVSIIIPTRASSGDVRGRSVRLIDECVATIVQKSTYRNFEIVIVLDTVAGDEAASTLRAIDPDRVHVVWWDEPFTFAGKMNHGVFHSRGEFVLFLNDDTEVISPDWIEAMLALCQRPQAGMSGSMLYFEDGSIQHAGHLYRDKGPGHIGFGRPASDRGPDDGYLVERESSGVTAACSMMPRSVFDEVGGFSILFPGNFNDVDLCMKVTSTGHAIYWTPHAELYHFESKTRFSRIADYELFTLRSRWSWRLEADPYWSAENAIVAQAPLLGSQT